MDGLAWIFYFESIVAGPITIVGTLSAAYPALTVLFARIFLNEKLQTLQYWAIAAVIAGCLGLSYAPPDPNAKVTQKRWIPFAASALILWGIAQTIVKWSYGLPNAHEANMALFNTFGGILTLGVYGLLKGRTGVHSAREWLKSFLPMGMMAGGEELDELSHELAEFARTDAAAGAQLAEAAREFGAEAQQLHESQGQEE